MAANGSHSLRVRQDFNHVRRLKNGKPSGPQREVLTGWMLSPDRVEVWGRPVALLQLPDGSVLISDDGGKKIWHLSYKG